MITSPDPLFLFSFVSASRRLRSSTSSDHFTALKNQFPLRNPQILEILQLSATVFPRKTEFLDGAIGAKEWKS
jgi:hypothetical protein